MVKHVYVISGLGADERAFERMQLPGATIHHIKWLKPDINESLENYAQRIIAHYIKTERPILIGLSFGGILSIEIAKQIDTEKIILLSSIKNQQEKGHALQKSFDSRWYKIVPKSLLKKTNPFIFWFFGLSETAERQKLKDIVADMDPDFFYWAMERIRLWRNEKPLPNLIHIHGNKDHVFPIKTIKADYVIDGGGHFMVLNRAKEVNEILQRELQLI